MEKNTGPLTVKSTLEIEETKDPSSEDVHFLTQMLDQESRVNGFQGSVFIPFGIFIKDEPEENKVKDKDGDGGRVIAGANGCVVFGAIYTDQLWVHPDHRGKGLGRKLMEMVHDFGRKENCQISYLTTMDFQQAEGFFHKLGYKTDIRRQGFGFGFGFGVDGKETSDMIFLQKLL